MLYRNITPEEAMFLEKIGGVSLGVGMSWLIKKDVVDITKKNAKLTDLRDAMARADGSGDTPRVTTLQKYIDGLEAQKTNKMIKIAQWVSFAALGVLVISVAFFAAELAPWMMLACSTSALVCSIFGHFHNVHCVNPIFQDPLVEEEGLGFTHDELREFHTDKWNIRTCFVPPGGGKEVERPSIGSLPREAEERLKTFYRNPLVLDKLGWPAANVEALAADG